MPAPRFRQIAIETVIVTGLAAGLAWGRCTARQEMRGQCMRTAYFYKPPADGSSARFIAHHFDLIFLTHHDEPYLRRLRARGYRGLILENLGASEAGGPGPYRYPPASCDASYIPFGRTVTFASGIFCRVVNRHESWFLHNRRGQRIYNGYRSPLTGWRTTYAMNPASRGWRRFVIAQLRPYRRRGFNGFFLDDLWLSRSGLRKQGPDADGLREFHTRAELQRAMAGYLRALRRAYPHTPIWANLTDDPYRAGSWRRYLPYLNGVMVENFALGWANYALPAGAARAQAANIRGALRAGKSVLLVAQGRRRQKRRRARAVRAFWRLARLPYARGRIYFRYADADVAAYRNVWWLKAYGHGPAQRRGRTPPRRSAHD